MTVFIICNEGLTSPQHTPDNDISAKSCSSIHLPNDCLTWHIYHSVYTISHPRPVLAESQSNKHSYCIERKLRSRVSWMLINEVWIVYWVESALRFGGRWLFILIQHILQINHGAVSWNQPFGEMEMFYYFANFSTRLLSYYSAVFIEFAEALVWHLNAIYKECLAY